MNKNPKRILSGLLAIALLLTSVVMPLVPCEPVLAATSTFYPDAHVETTSVDGDVARQSDGWDTWAQIRGGVGNTIDDADDEAAILLMDGQGVNTFLELRRGVTIFDTSPLPDTCVINSATLSLYGAAKDDAKGMQPNINVYSVNTSGSTALANFDYNIANWGSTAFSTTITYAGWSTSGYNDFVLNASGLAAISKTGVTKLGLREVSHDVANSAPGWNSYLTTSYLDWWTAEKGAGFKPKLVINYTEIVAPEITADDASNIGQTTARLNSTLDNDGNDECEVRFGYGTTSEAAVDFLDYDTVTDWVDGYTSGEHPFINVDSLVADTTYFYRVQARNSEATIVTSDEITFDTEASLNEPTNFRAIPEANSVHLSWTKGVGASTTLIRYSFEDYPDGVGVGVELYTGTGSSTTHTGLTAGTTIYYSAWGESGGGYSASYTELLVTTLAGTDIDIDLSSPIEPTNWFLDVDYTTQSNMPFYSTINDIADGVSVPRTTAWMMAGIMVSMMGAYIAYRWRQDLLSASIVMVILLGLASAQQLVPGWMLLISVIIIIGMGLTRRRLGS